MLNDPSGHTLDHSTYISSITRAFNEYTVMEEANFDNQSLYLSLNIGYVVNIQRNSTAVNVLNTAYRKFRVL